MPEYERSQQTVATAPPAASSTLAHQQQVTPDQSHLDGGFAKRIADGELDVTSVNGTRTLTGDLDRPSGNRFVDAGGICETQGGGDCFLTEKQRTRLASTYGGRVQQAFGVYLDALSNLKFERLLEHGKSDLPWFLSLVLDVVGATALAGLVHGIKALHAASIADIERGFELSAEQAAAAHKSLVGGATSGLEKLSKGVVDRTKKQATASLSAQLEAEKSSKRNAAVSYIEELKRTAGQVFQALREEPPGLATDAQMLVLLNGFDESNHTPAIYRRSLEDKLQRFGESGITEIGRSEDQGPELGTGDRREPHSVMRDRVVVRVTFKSGYPQAYAIARKDWGDPMTASMNRPASAVAPEEFLPLDEEKWKGEVIPEEIRHNIQPEIIDFIRAEFVDVALQRHRQIWGKEPEWVEVDDSHWFWDKQRSARAVDNKKHERHLLDGAFDAIRTGGAR